MKKTKIVLLTITAIVMIILPFISVITLAVSLPAQFDQSFVGALSDKCERLYSIDEPKIVIVGGSSVAFGIDSALIEKYTDMPVVNFGMYAALGTKLMLDLSRDAIGEGDVVVLAPELDAQTMSMYFSSESTLRAFDGNFELIKHLPEENLFPLLSGMWKLAVDKLNYMKNGKPDPEGVYNSKNFNEYGDLVYDRTENVMELYYDPAKVINPDASIIEDEFIEYLNEYVEECEGKGATVLYSFCPMNEMAIADGSDAISRDEFSEYLSSVLTDCEIISNIEDYIYEAGYFYDTNFHLNEAGVRLHTVNLIRDLLLFFGIPKHVDEQIPEAPPLPSVEVRYDGEDENAVYFTYEQLESGAYRISGLSDLGKQQKSLTVPLGYNGYKVVSIGSGAFSGSVLEELILTVDTNIRSFDLGSFDGVPSMRDLWIYYPMQDDILPPPNFDGVNPVDFEVHIPEESYYDVRYGWGDMGLKFVKDAN